MKTVGVVLAGGGSKRFGKPKAFAVYREKFFYQWVFEALRPHVSEIVVSASEQLRNQFQEYRVFQDESRFKGKGPLAGIHAVMKAVAADWYFVIACDMPLMTGETVSKILHTAQQSPTTDAVVPESEGRLQPLAGVYHRRTLDKLESLLQKNILHVRAFLDEIEVYPLQGLDPQCFYNINTKEDLAQLKGEKRQ